MLKKVHTKSYTGSAITEPPVKRYWKRVSRNWQLYLLISPVVLYFIIFHYIPMYGVQLAFKNFIATEGIMGSPWVGFDHFERFFSSYYFERLIINTVGISLYQLIVCFPFPIILAIMLNEVRAKYYKKTIQMVTYAPHFISVIVLAGITVEMLSPTKGVINTIIKFFGNEPIYFMAKKEYFKTIYVLTEVWQNSGCASIIYIAALANVSTELHESARIDGANRLQKIIHIDIPSIIPTIVILLILNVGKLMSVGFDKVFALQNSLNMETSDVISTYIYRAGILGAEYSFATAIGLFNSVINCALLLIVNHISKRVSETSLW